MFLIQTPGGLSVATDYTGYTGPAPFLPTAVTMNHAHSSHWTEFVDPGIPHVLPGWGTFGEGIEHHLDLDEMLIRNVSPTSGPALAGSRNPATRSSSSRSRVFASAISAICTMNRMTNNTPPLAALTL